MIASVRLQVVARALFLTSLLLAWLQMTTLGPSPS